MIAQNTLIAFRTSIFAFCISFILVACGGGTSVSGNQPPSGATGTPPAGTPPTVSGTINIAWPENPSADNVTHYVVSSRNINTNANRSLTLSVSGAAPDITASNGMFSYQVNINNMGITTPGTYAITIAARNSVGTSPESQPEYVSF